MNSRFKLQTLTPHAPIVRVHSSLKGCSGVVPILSPFNATVALGFL